MGGPLRRGWALAAALGLAGALALPASAFRDDVVLISQGTGGAAADGPSDEPAISAEGRFVAFTSSATGLSADDSDTASDVFVRDVETGTTRLVSRAAGSAGPGGDGDSGAPAISADGRRVAFASRATNLSADDADGTWDVFVRDLGTGALTLVSRADGTGGAGGDLGSFAPAISADGRHVAFHSLATNLGPDAAGFDVFVRDLAGGTTTLASRAAGADGAPGDGPSTDAAISGDGRRVAFASAAANLAADAAGEGGTRILVRDLDLATTTLASRAGGAAGTPADAPALRPSISDDGARVAFESAAGALHPDDRDATTDVFVRDLAAASTTLVSRATGASGAAGDGNSTGAAISADGRRVAFTSSAADLSDGDDDALADVFVRDLDAATTILASRAAGPMGAPADGGSRDPAVSADGALVAFATEADNLAPGGDPRVTNVVRRDVLGAPAPVAAPAPAAPVAPAPAPAPAHPVVVAHRCSGVAATIVGTPGADVIRGTRGRDVIVALGGDDVVRGLGGADLICLGPGADRGDGGAGGDSVLGGPGADDLRGGTGRDLLLGGGGRDRAHGGRGRDLCMAEARLACESPRRSTGRLR